MHRDLSMSRVSNETMPSDILNFLESNLDRRMMWLTLLNRKKTKNK